MDLPSRLAVLCSGLVFFAGCVPETEPSAEPTSTTESSTSSTTAPDPSVTSGGSTAAPPGDTTQDTTQGSETSVPDTGEGPPPDLPDNCSTIEQDCPAGYKCMPSSRSLPSPPYEAECVPVSPDPVSVGEACVYDVMVGPWEDDCDATSMCWFVDPKTWEGICVPFCTGTEAEPGCAEDCRFCNISAKGVINLCFESCDPVVQDCARAEACYPVGGSFMCLPDQSAPGSDAGSECSLAYQCPAGMFCIDALAVPGCGGAGLGCCAPACAVGGVDPCPGLLAGTECVPWYEDGGVPPSLCGSADPGVCAIP